MRIVLASLLVLSSAGMSLAATATNLDADVQTLLVTEGDDRTELSIGPGETVEFCAAGCFVTLPNGDREALTGSETLEISGGAGQVR